MLKTFQKFAAATALSLPLMMSGALNAQTAPMYDDVPPGTQPPACSQSTTLAALNNCLSFALPLSEGAHAALTNEIIPARQAFDYAMSVTTPQTEQRIRGALRQFEQRNIAACTQSQNSVDRFNYEWNNAINRSPVTSQSGDLIDKLPYIQTTPGLRQATREYMAHSAECLSTGIDVLQFVLEKSGNSAVQVQKIVNPLYENAYYYRQFDMN